MVAGVSEWSMANSELLIADRMRFLHTRSMFKFEKLDVLAKAFGVDFADLVYSKPKSFPSDERFGLTNQMRRAAVSVSSNIAEGSARISDADFARFVEIATGSLLEVVSESTPNAFGARRQGYLSAQDFAAICKAAEEQGRMLSGLRRTLVGD
jgi:four helix bundle protein